MRTSVLIQQKNWICPSLFLFVLMTFFHINAAADSEAIPWTPPHIINDLDSTYINTHLSPLLKADAFHFITLLLLELLRYSLYRTSQLSLSSEGAMFLADSSVRLADAFMDGYASSGYGDFALRGLFSNLDILPWWYKAPWLLRTSLSYMYALRNSFYQSIWPPEPKPNAPILIYLHDSALNSLIDIIWVPASNAEEYDPTAGHSNYFILKKKESDIPCNKWQAEKNTISVLAHRLNCISTSENKLTVHLYPLVWQGENRLFIRLFRNNRSGPLYLSPYTYGVAGETWFFTEIMESIQSSDEWRTSFATGEYSYFGQFMAMTENSTTYQNNLQGTVHSCRARHHWNIANPLHETTFSLLHKLLQNPQADEVNDELSGSALFDSLSNAILLEEQGTTSAESETYESDSLSMISSGEQTFLVLDWGKEKSRRPVISFETRYEFKSAQTQLEALEQLRPQTPSQHWLLVSETLNLLAMQSLAGYTLASFNRAYNKPRSDEEAMMTPNNPGNKVRKIAGDPSPTKSNSAPSSYGKPQDQAQQSHRPQRRRRPPIKFRNDDENEPSKRQTDKERKTIKPRNTDKPRGIKKRKDIYGEPVVVVHETEQEGTARKRPLPESEHWSARNPEGASGITLIFSRKKLSDKETTDKLPTKPPTHGDPEACTERLTCPPDYVFMGKQQSEVLPQSIFGRKPLNSDTPGSSVDKSSSIASMPPWRCTLAESGSEQTTQQQTTKALSPPMHSPATPPPAINTDESDLQLGQTSLMRALMQRIESALQTTQGQIRIATPLSSQAYSGAIPQDQASSMQLNTKGTESSPKDLLPLGIRSTRTNPGESEGGIPCPVIGCKTKNGIHYRFSSYEYWWGHIKAVHAGITYGGQSYVTTHDHGEGILVKQGDLQCKIDSCGSFDSPKAFGKHLALEHFRDLDQQPFNPYQQRRLLYVADKMNVKLNEGQAQFIHGEKYSCGVAGCDHTFSYNNDQAMYKDLLSHRQQHPHINAGRNTAGPDLSKMTSPKDYRHLAKKYQTRFGKGFHCAEHPSTELGQFPEALARHYLDVHLKETIHCPVRDCNDPHTQLRTQFTTLEALYAHHGQVHQKKYLDSLPPDTDPGLLAEGWVPENNIDLFMLQHEDMEVELATEPFDSEN